MDCDNLCDGLSGILAVGGDGTVIRSAGYAVPERVPVLGVHFGHLGYLCDFNEDTIFEAIPRLLDEDYETEERMMLSGKLIAADGSAVTGRIRALNDIVITARNGLSVVRIVVSVGGERLYAFNGDGMIFATPTGSTAYNMAANGPIVDPKTRLILMTPLNPHTLSTRSIVLDPSDDIELILEQRAPGVKEEAIVSFDGTQSFMLHPGDKLSVRASTKTTLLLRLTRMNFLERIREKMKN